MSHVIRIPSNIYSRLEQHAKGFDTPANIIEKLLNYYEGVNEEVPKQLQETLLSKRLFNNKEIQQKISQIAQIIPEHELEKLCNRTKSKEIFNIDEPLFIKCSKNISGVSKRDAVKDKHGISRWTWKFEFERNNFIYAITTQWYSRHDVKVREWLNEHQ